MSMPSAEKCIRRVNGFPGKLMRGLISSRQFGISTGALLIVLLGCTEERATGVAQDYPEDSPFTEDSEFQDMMSPLYYHTDCDPLFRDEINRFLQCARGELFHHPLESGLGHVPQFSTPAMGAFGAVKGPDGAAQHHPAVDLHVGRGETDVTMYASHDGYVTTYRDAPKYRQYLGISTDVVDVNGKVIGRIVSLYAHLDLDLDEADSLLMNGQFVRKGDAVSRHLYSGTMGGPHLHFEVRYYRPGDDGDETFYGFVGPRGSPVLTEPSAGPWIHGHWNTAVGYGFGEPRNHGLQLEQR
jgi:murein DD-endopeptidase MepM/ murein hydrolase activator NlpD